MKLFSMIAVLGLIALPADAASIDEAAKEVVGGWKIEFTTPDGEFRTPFVVVGRQRSEFVAWYITDGKREAFSKVELDGEQLRLTIRPEEFGGDVKATLVAHLTESDVCTGTVKYAENLGESGEFSFKGKRIDVSELAETDVWGIGFVTPDGIRRDATVTVIAMGEELIAWYSGEEYELPAEKITVTGDQVLMSLSVKTETGETVDVSFQGVIDGPRVRGDAKWSIQGETGSFPFTGQRKS